MTIAERPERISISSEPIPDMSYEDFLNRFPFLAEHEIKPFAQFRSEKHKTSTPLTDFITAIDTIPHSYIYKNAYAMRAFGVYAESGRRRVLRMSYPDHFEPEEWPDGNYALFSGSWKMSETTIVTLAPKTTSE